jgi:GT2 family glycosyltransferase
MDEVSLIGGEETEWHKRFRDRGWSIVFLHDAPVVHLGGQTLRTHPALRGEYLKGMFNYFRKHRSPLVYGLLRVAAVVVLLVRAVPGAWRRDVAGRALITDLLRTAWRWSPR